MINKFLLLTRQSLDRVTTLSNVSLMAPIVFPYDSFRTNPNSAMDVSGRRKQLESGGILKQLIEETSRNLLTNLRGQEARVMFLWYRRRSPIRLSGEQTEPRVER